MAEDDEDDEGPRRGRRDEDDEEEDRPRRRSGRRSRAEAEAAVAGPGLALVIIGVLGLLYAVINVVGLAVGGPARVGNPFGPPAGNVQQRQAFNQGFQAGQQVGTVVGAILPFVWGGVVLLGGVNLRRLGGRGSSLAAAVFALLPCSPCCLAGIPVGIWALVVLNRDEVRRSMG